MAFLYGRAGRLTAKNDGFRPGQWAKENASSIDEDGRAMVRTGRELWNWLNPRIRQLVFLQTQWGSVHDVYGAQKGSMFEEKPVPKWIRDPDSTFSGYWDVAQIFFLLYIT